MRSLRTSGIVSRNRYKAINVDEKLNIWLTFFAGDKIGKSIALRFIGKIALASPACL